MQQENPQAETHAHGALVSCVECGNRFPEGEVIQFGGYWVCANCKPLFQQKLAEGSFRPGDLVFASVGRRFVALFLDGLLLWFIMAISFMGVFALMSHGGDPKRLAAGTAVWYLFSFGANAAYMIFFTGRFGATPGKMALKSKVVRADGSPIGYGLATGRFFATFVSSMTFGIGYLMAFFDKDRRTLHDRICGTRVVRP